ncbi:MAG: Tad domain-containing protein [Planctomycetota bacterium]
MLVWFAVFIFVALALAALVIDGGLALLTRRQLQTAAHCGALEGARRPLGLDDATHRVAVARIVGQVFDDNLDPSDGDAIGFGAGPDFDYAGGLTLPGTDYAASPMIVLGSQSVHKPALGANTSNHVAGDLVRGDYDAAESRHREGIDSTSSDYPYDRDDFVANAAGDAFLLRVRRTGEAFTALPGGGTGIATTGRRVPYLFGRVAAGGPEWLDERSRGIAVRATAIARRIPALTVGPAIPTSVYGGSGSFPELLGRAPFAVAQASWNAAAEIRIDIADVGLASPVRLVGLGWLSAAADANQTSLTVASAVGFPTTRVYVARCDNELWEVAANGGSATWTITRGFRGSTAASHASGAIIYRSEPLSVGASLASWQVVPGGGLPAPGEGFSPLFAELAGAGERVVGFGRATWRYEGDELVITRAADQLAVRNAAAHFHSALPSDLNASQIAALLTANRQTTSPLQAAVLARSID